MEDQYLDEINSLNRQALQQIQNFLEGDSRAFHALVELFEKRVLRIVKKMVYTYHDVEDLHNEIWLKVAQNLHKFDQSLPFHSWLYRLASNVCIDFLRKKREIIMEDDQLFLQVNKHASHQTETPESVILQKELAGQLQDLLKRLDETDRLIVTLRFSEELSYDEIGRIVGMSKNTVGTRLFRARKLLKELLEKQKTERRIVDAAY